MHPQISAAKRVIIAEVFRSCLCPYSFIIEAIGAFKVEVRPIDRERTLLMLLTKALGASRALQTFAMMRKTHEYHKEMDIYERSTTIFRFKRQLDAACLE